MRSLHSWSPSRQIRAAGAIFALLLFSYAYFPPMHDNPNPVSHLALALSLVEDGTTTIDEFQEETVDTAAVNGHYYSNKAPGLALMATPVVALLAPLASLASLPEAHLAGSEFTLRWEVTVYLATVLTSGAWTAAAAAALYLVALRLEANGTGALFAALGFGLASPAWGWATNLFSHAVAGALLFLGFAAVHHLATRPAGRSRHDVLIGCTAGSLLVWALVVEYSAGPAAALVGLYGLIMARHWPRARLGRVVLAALAGGALAAIPLLVYNAVSFGSPFTLGYQHTVAFASGFERGLLGISLPNLEALYGITLSPFRGLLVFCPLALLFPFAVWSLGRVPGGRGIAWLASAIVLYFLWFNSSFHYWSGGASTGPRYLVPMLPFLFLPYARFWTTLTSPAARALVLALLALSFAISLLSVSTSMAAWEEIRNPIVEFLLPRFLHGQVRTVFLPLGWTSAAAVLFFLVLLAAGLALIFRIAGWPRLAALERSGQEGHGPTGAA